MLAFLRCKSKLAIATYMVWGSLGVANAQFDLSFQSFTPGPGEVYEEEFLNCNFSHMNSCYRGDHVSANLEPDLSPILIEVVRATNGRLYYHAVIGDPDSDFAYEYYIQAGWTPWPDNNDYDSASGGGYNGGADAKQNNATWYDPLHATMAGSGSGAPNRTSFRLKIDGNGFSQDMIKETLGRKPKINQQLNDGGVVSNFLADMSAISYSDSSTQATMVNTMSVTDLDSGEVYANFDMDNPLSIVWPAGVQGDKRVIDVNATAGMYYHTGGLPFRDSNGTYVYQDGGGLDIYDFDWEVYWDENVNVPNF